MAIACMSTRHFIKPVCSTVQKSEQFYFYPLAIVVTHCGKQQYRCVHMVIILKKEKHFYFKLQAVVFSPAYLVFNFSLRRQNERYILALFILVVFPLVTGSNWRCLCKGAVSDVILLFVLDLMPCGTWGESAQCLQVACLMLGKLVFNWRQILKEEDRSTSLPPFCSGVSVRWLLIFQLESNLE